MKKDSINVVNTKLQNIYLRGDFDSVFFCLERIRIERILVKSTQIYCKNIRYNFIGSRSFKYCQVNRKFEDVITGEFKPVLSLVFLDSLKDENNYLD